MVGDGNQNKIIVRNAKAYYITQTLHAVQKKTLYML